MWLQQCFDGSSLSYMRRISLIWSWSMTISCLYRSWIQRVLGSRLLRLFLNGKRRELISQLKMLLWFGPSPSFPAFPYRLTFSEYQTEYTLQFLQVWHVSLPWSLKWSNECTCMKSVVRLTFVPTFVPQSGRVEAAALMRCSATVVFWSCKTSLIKLVSES